MSDANTAALAAAAASKDDIPDDNAASTAGKNRNLPESSSDEEDGNSKKRKVSFPWHKSSDSSDEDDWENPCICKYYKGDNPMCREKGHKALGKIAIPMKEKGARPKDWVEGEPRTPPHKTSDTSFASASNVIDLSSDKQNLAAVFECEPRKDEPKKENIVDAMLKHAGVSSFDTYPRTIEHASEYARACYMSKYSHLKPSAAPNTKDGSAAAPSKKTASKESALVKTSRKRKKLKQSSAAPSAKAASTAASAANEVISVDDEDDGASNSQVCQGITLLKPPASKKSKVWQYYRVFPSKTHPEMKDHAVCWLCFENGETVTIAANEDI